MALSPASVAPSSPAFLYNRQTVVMKTGDELDPHQAYLASIDRTFNDLLNIDLSDPSKMLRSILKDGMNSLWQWQVEQLKRRVADQVMKEMNLTPEQLAAMPPAQRISIEQKIMEEVERRVKQIIEENAQKKNKTPLAISQITLDSETALALLQAK